MISQVVRTWSCLCHQPGCPQVQPENQNTTQELCVRITERWDSFPSSRQVLDCNSCFSVTLFLLLNYTLAKNVPSSSSVPSLHCNFLPIQVIPGIEQHPGGIETSWCKAQNKYRTRYSLCHQEVTDCHQPWAGADSSLESRHSMWAQQPVCRLNNAAEQEQREEKARSSNGLLCMHGGFRSHPSHCWGWNTWWFWVREA